MPALHASLVFVFDDFFTMRVFHRLTWMYQYGKCICKKVQNFWQKYTLVQQACAAFRLTSDPSSKTELVCVAKKSHFWPLGRSLCLSNLSLLYFFSLFHNLHDLSLSAHHLSYEKTPSTGQRLWESITLQNANTFPKVAVNHCKVFHFRSKLWTMTPWHEAGLDTCQACWQHGKRDQNQPGSWSTPTILPRASECAVQRRMTRRRQRHGLRAQRTYTSHLAETVEVVHSPCTCACSDHRGSMDSAFFDCPVCQWQEKCSRTLARRSQLSAVVSEPALPPFVSFSNFLYALFWLLVDEGFGQLCILSVHRSVKFRK